MVSRQRRSGRELVLDYYRKHLGEWVHNQTLREVSGMNDVPRVVRALRQSGWQIEVRGDGYSRLTALEQSETGKVRKAISRKLRYEVLNRDNFRCRACGRGPDDGVKLEIDHIVPVEWGGATSIDNLQTLCEACNQGKKAWVTGRPLSEMNRIMSCLTVEARIEALFDAFPDQDVPSSLIHLVSKSALDWQRALRRIRQRSGKRIVPVKGRAAYHYYKREAPGGSV